MQLEKSTDRRTEPSSLELNMTTCVAAEQDRQKQENPNQKKPSVGGSIAAPV